MRAISLIVNPSAGGGRAGRVLPRVEVALHELGVDAETHETRGLDHAAELARRALDAQRVPVALGGDGLVGAVAGALSGIAGGVLGVLPGGRGNDLARVLGIPLDAVDACATIASGVERALDLGAVGERLFVGIASAGFDSDANRIANQTSARLGNFVYAYGALRALVSWKPATFTLELDGEQRSFTGYSFAAANSKAYGGGMYLAPDAQLDDGLLDIVISRQVSKARFLLSLPKVFKGEHVKEPSVEVLRARELRVSADRPFTIYADGDPIGELPAVIRAVPGAVRVLVPGGR
ncbi:MAG: diacylglycerol kinase family protein [Solirubrobacteraceae bacterium]